MSHRNSSHLSAAMDMTGVTGLCLIETVLLHVMAE
jgi:hypothetical protein